MEYVGSLDKKMTNGAWPCYASMLTTVHLKGMVLPEVKPPTVWKLDIILETNQPLNQLC